jgi:hypothetical protein
MKKLLIFLLPIFIFLVPLVWATPISSVNTSVIFENLYLRVAPGTEDGVIDLYYKDKVGNWKKYNSLTVVLKAEGEELNAKDEKISFVAEQQIDGLSSRPDLVKVKFQYGTFKNGAQVYLMMEMEQSKPYVKFSVFPNAASNEITELGVISTNGLEDLVQKIKINGTTYEAGKCGSYSPGCTDIRTIADGQSFTLLKPDNKIITLEGESGLRQLIFFDQDFGSNDKVVTSVKTKGASGTNSSATSSAKRKEESWFQTTYLLRNPFDGDTNNFYFGVDLDSIKGSNAGKPKEKRNLNFRLKLAGVEKNIGARQVDVTVKSKKTTVFEDQIAIIGTSTGVYVGTMENLPGTTALEIFIHGPKHLTTRFVLPIGVETIDWTSQPLKGGDSNGDDRVDSTDFAMMQRDYLQNITSGADFNFDTRVDSTDFAILQAAYKVRAAKP